MSREMTRVEKAIQELKYTFKSMVLEDLETLNMAVAALEKQEPKAPTIKNGWAECSSCNTMVHDSDRWGAEIFSHAFCPRCGQAVLWR